MYQKEIIYMGLYKDGNRMGSAGFLKAENRENESRLHLKLQNIPPGINGRFPIRLYNGSGWKEINGVTVQDGGGNWEECLVENIYRPTVQIMLPGGYLLKGQSRHASGAAAPEAAAEPGGAAEPRSAAEPGSAAEPWRAEEPGRAEDLGSAEGPGRADMAGRGDTPGNTGQLRREEISGTIPQTIIISEELPRLALERDVTPLQDAIPAPPQRMTPPQSAAPAPPQHTGLPRHTFKEDKWEQLLDTYEQIHPYDDDRIYVKLEPGDFVILQSKYQHLVNNSFLLHGFYNYRYLILGKEPDCFYLGVPGVFYEREKMVALMFGFEAFECPGGSVAAGEFGYYLRKVEL